MLENQKTRRSEAGFTLVEIAIVLIIIGLLIGGIIKGQAMIQNAKVKRLVRDIDGMRAAVLTYQDKFGMLPGDESDVNTPTAADTNQGDANGLMDETDGWEIEDLRFAEIIPGTGTALPRNAFGGTIGVDYVDLTGSANYIIVTNIPAEVCQEIDTKYDDGSPTAGEIRGGTAYTAGATIAVFGWKL